MELIHENTNNLNSLKKTFSEAGFLGPHPILNPTETHFYRSQIENFLHKIHGRLDAVSRHKPHLYLKWANDLARHPEICKVVNSLLGPDVLLWYSVLFVKPAFSQGEVPWHQDSTYWALDQDHGVTAWIALSEVNEQNGCVEFIPGSHLSSNHRHDIDNSETNLLARGQKIIGFECKETLKMCLAPGQASFHHPSVLHCSKANNSAYPRLGIAFRYIPASNFPRTLTWMRRSATLISGTDRLQKFSKDPVPRFDYDPQGLSAHRLSVKKAAVHTLFGDTSRTSLKKILDLAPILLTKKTLTYLRRWGLDVEQNRDS